MNNICNLKDIYKAVYDFEKSFLSIHNITINEAMILCCLKDGSCRNAGELHDFVGLSKSRMSRIINAVEAKGFISRNFGEGDKRQMIFSLTPLGMQKVTDMMSRNVNFSELKNTLSDLLR